MPAKSHHARLFEQLVKEHRTKVVEAILGGVAPDWYRDLVGEIRGLDAALKLSEEADFQLSGEQ